MNLILFLIFAIGIICIMSGYYSDKISKQLTTTIKYIPQYSSPNLNIGSKLHNFYSSIFNKADRWTTHPYSAADGLAFPTMKPISSTDFMNKWTWPTFTRDENSKYLAAPINNNKSKTLGDCEKTCIESLKSLKPLGKGHDFQKECLNRCSKKESGSKKN